MHVHTYRRKCVRPCVGKILPVFHESWICPQRSHQHQRTSQHLSGYSPSSQVKIILNFDEFYVNCRLKASCFCVVFNLTSGNIRRGEPADLGCTSDLALAMCWHEDEKGGESWGKKPSCAHPMNPSGVSAAIEPGDREAQVCKSVSLHRFVFTSVCLFWHILCTSGIACCLRVASRWGVDDDTQRICEKEKLQHAAPQCSTLQHTATHANTRGVCGYFKFCHSKCEQIVCWQCQSACEAR